MAGAALFRSQRPGPVKELVDNIGHALVPELPAPFQIVRIISCIYCAGSSWTVVVPS